MKSTPTLLRMAALALSALAAPSPAATPCGALTIYIGPAGSDDAMYWGQTRCWPKNYRANI